MYIYRMCLLSRVKVLIFEASTSIDGDLTFFAAGDCVLMRPSDSDKPPYVARVEKLKADHRNSVQSNMYHSTLTKKTPNPTF